ncbi:MAG: Ohr family peroxiredoxin [Deltaproteobacteria bacterium]|nr:Ohr family peroxiredoxin [Nannocystaceae bacterium]
MTTLYTAHVHIDSGRDGSIRADDGKLEARLAYPKSLGGDGDGTNPEQLFGAAYGACFGSTLSTIAKAEGKVLRNVHVDAEVELHSEDGNYGLAVRLGVRAEGVDRPGLEGLIEKAKVTCPYARAVRNNVVTTVSLV